MNTGSCSSFEELSDLTYFNDPRFFMNTENLLEPLHQLLTQAQALLILAQEKNWDELQHQFAPYQQQMAVLADENYLQALKAANLSAAAQALIVEIHAGNEQLAVDAAQGYENIASELRQIIQSDKAMDAYSR
jgi:hypothetical protein